MSKFDPTKPVRTKAGRAARIIATDRRSPTRKYPIVALVDTGSGVEVSRAYTETGRYTSDGVSPLDLVNIPETRTRYLNLGDAHSGHDYSMYHSATKHRSPWDVLELVTEGDDIISTRIIPHEEASERP